MQGSLFGGNFDLDSAFRQQYPHFFNDDGSTKLFHPDGKSVTREEAELVGPILPAGSGPHPVSPDDLHAKFRRQYPHFFNPDGTVKVTAPGALDAVSVNELDYVRKGIPQKQMQHPQQYTQYPQQQQQPQQLYSPQFDVSPQLSPYGNPQGLPFDMLQHQLQQPMPNYQPQYNQPMPCVPEVEDEECQPKQPPPPTQRRAPLQQAKKSALKSRVDNAQQVSTFDIVQKPLRMPPPSDVQLAPSVPQPSKQISTAVQTMSERLPASQDKTFDVKKALREQFGA